MAVRNWLISTDASVILSTLGNTVDQHHPVGKHQTSGNVYRAYLKFTMDFTSMVTITQARLYMKKSETHIGVGASNSVRVKKLTATPGNTQGGSAEGTWSSSASPKAAVASTTTDQSAATTLGTTTGNWYYIDITSMSQAWLAGGTHYGVEVKAESEASNTNAWEFNSKDSSSDPYIEVTYTTNTIPSQPTINSPASGSRIAGPSATYNFTHVDSDGDALLNYDIQVSTDSTFASVTHWNAASQTAGISGNIVNIAHGGSALSRNTWYYWRVATRSATGETGVGPWSGTQQFYINNLPTATLTDPATTGYLGHMVYTAGSGWASPRLRVAWSYSDVDSDAQASYQVVITESTTAGGSYSAFYDSGVVNSAATSIDAAATFIEGRFYKTYVLVKDAYGEWSTAHQDIIVRARWATATHRKDVNVGGNIPTSWDVTTLNTTTTGTSSVTVEYNSTSDGTTGLGSWQASLTSVTKQKWAHYRVWLMCWGAATPASPSLDAITITASGLVLTADFWTSVGTGSPAIDISTRTFGTQSQRLNGTSTWTGMYQVVTVDKNTDYILQWRAKSVGNSQPYVYVNVGGLDVGVTTWSRHPADTDWRYYANAPFNTGENTTLTVYCASAGATGTTAWFDGIKLERGRVATPWSPGLVGTATTVDAGGLQVDASAGGKFRIRGSGGGGRDIIELGTNGLKFGGDTNVYARNAGELLVPQLDGFGAYSLRANRQLTGGGNITFDSSNYFGWSDRFIPISLGLGPESTTHGYYDILQPTTGTVTGVGGASNVTATSAGIPLADWHSLYVILPKNGAFNVLTVSDYRVMNYPNSQEIPSNWLWLATHNADTGAGTTRGLWVNNRGIITKGNGLLKNDMGTAFPTSGLFTGARFYRSDHQVEFYYDGTRWLCTCPHTLQYPTDLGNLAATSTDISRASPPSNFVTTNVWVTRFGAGYQVASGGSALSGSQSWTVNAQRFGSTATSTISAITINSGSSGVWRRDADVTVNAVLDLSVTSGINLSANKLNNPGNLYFYPYLVYRYIAT